MSSTPTILLLNLPPKTFIGIDLATFNSSPNFHGITNIPPGLHFLYTGTDASLSVRQGFWLKADHPQVFRWNTDTEQLDLLPADSDSAKAAIRAIPSLKQRLVDYKALVDATRGLQTEQSDRATSNSVPNTSRSTQQLRSNAEENAEDISEAEETTTKEDTDSRDLAIPWPKLSSHITTRLLSRILPPSLSLTSISSSPLDSEHIPGFSDQETNEILSGTHTLSLLAIDLKQTWPDTAVGRDRTIMARDRSWYLSHLIEQLRIPAAGSDASEIGEKDAANELLGELQFCFLMVLCLANYSCFEQWKRLLNVICTCRQELERQNFFVEVVDVLREQLGRVEDVEGGLFEMADENGSAWLRKLLRGFRRAIDEVLGEEQHKGKRLKEKLGGLEQWLRETYGWQDDVLRKGMVQLEDGEMVEIDMDGFDEEEEQGEYAPVVVE